MQYFYANYVQFFIVGWLQNMHEKYKAALIETCMGVLKYDTNKIQILWIC